MRDASAAMKKKERPSFLRQLQERYGPNRERLRDGARPLPPPYVAPEDPHLPRVLPTSSRKTEREQRKGAIPMSVSQFVTLSIVFIVIAWAGAAGLAYGVVQATAGGPEGPQGIQGIEGPIGPEGPQGPPGDDAAQEMVKRMAGLWAVQQASTVRGGAFVEFNNPEIGACVNYIMTGKPGSSACPGFTDTTR
jgi:hypothetical protein